MRKSGKRFAALLWMIPALLMVTICAAAEETASPVTTLVPPTQESAEDEDPVIERDYEVGDSGDDVYAFKLRMQYLGYFLEDADISDKITELTLKRVNMLLEDNGMETVEVITMDIQEMIFEDDSLASGPTPTPSPTPEPLIMPESEPELPVLDDEGFLADEDGEYIYENEEDGLWYYISNTLYINIRRYNDQEEENIWFETEIKTRGDEQIQSFHEDTMSVYQTPVTIARTNSAVLAFTDDFFTKREYGVIIRDGEVIRDERRSSTSAFPLGDAMAILEDGTMSVYDYYEYDAEDFLEMGAVQVLSFGPWLIRDGEINPLVLTGEYMQYHEPRCAIGMIEANHYVVITVDGRYDGASGAYFSWVAERMQEIGVTEALNLDGGGTTALVFMGEQISQATATDSDGEDSRRVCSLLGFGISDAVPDP